MGEEAHTIPVSRSDAPMKPRKDGNFYKRAAYEADDGDLLPQPKKPPVKAAIPVELADAKAVVVAPKKKGPTLYVATKKPKLFFSGNVTVSDIPDEKEVIDLEVENHERRRTIPLSIDDSKPRTRSKPHIKPTKPVVTEKPTAVPTTPASEEHVSSESAATKISVTLDDTPAQSLSLKPGQHRLSNPHGIIGMQRQRISDRNPLGGTVKVAMRSPDATPLVASRWPLLVAIIGGAVISAFLIGIEVELEVIGDSFLEAAYQYNLDSLGAMVRSAMP